MLSHVCRSLISGPDKIVLCRVCFAASICGGGKSLVSHSCPTKWEMQGRYCYYFSSEKKNWTDALWHCINKKANLASVWSDEEQVSLFASAMMGEVFWDKGEPQMSHEKNCGIIQPNGTWASAMCSLHHHWICKKKLIC
ncbi:hypothetical protein JD844_011864 [Phrynosoma platyrhinos]|uniref:C-type lectin domain-containing protein n=1 Tax=Phrynosoma platyrhinos TaxID=52577 RepID=A0ABQ7TJ46_PHRPL|nr:hypothetical protein JD844_011864 [Phrynosoma platyrhinos]